MSRRLKHNQRVYDGLVKQWPQVKWRVYEQRNGIWTETRIAWTGGPSVDDVYRSPAIWGVTVRAEHKEV